MSQSTAPKRISLVRLCTTLAAFLALALAPSAATASTPLLNLGPIAVANGTAALAGTVGSDGAGMSLTVNGQPLAVNAAGQFDGLVSLNGASAINLTLSGASGDQTISFEVPLTAALLGPNGVIPTGVLNSIEQAGISLLTPVAGKGALPVTVGGSVADSTQLASLSVNGQDVLSRLTNGGTFTTQVPGSTKTVELSATDTKGVSETRTRYLRRQLSVSAASATGVRIVKVRFYPQNAVRTHRMRMVITVKDRLGRPIRGARVTVSSTKPGFLAKRPKTTLTGRGGKATVILSLRKRALGKRLVVLTVAKTPKAKARKMSAVRLPRGH
ncbi:MAG: hypothetical protein WBB76_11905 [Gaiellaceae bacterium]